MTITLQLDGLHCGNCVKSVEKALNGVAGVNQVSVTLERKLLWWKAQQKHKP